jgi:hypothetical protein
MYGGQPVDQLELTFLGRIRASDILSVDTKAPNEVLLVLVRGTSYCSLDSCRSLQP